MNNFGKYAVVDNVRHYLEKEPELWWEFKPPTARDEIAINRFTQGNSIKQTVQGIERKIVTTAEIALQELALTFADCNFTDDKGNPMFGKARSIDDVKDIIETFPKELFYELWRALGETCPGWGALPLPPADDDDGDSSEDVSVREYPKEQASSND